MIADFHFGVNYHFKLKSVPLQKTLNAIGAHIPIDISCMVKGSLNIRQNISLCVPWKKVIQVWSDMMMSKSKSLYVVL